MYRLSSPDGTSVSVKAPISFVVVFCGEPLTTILTFATGSPERASTTRPWRVTKRFGGCCAQTLVIEPRPSARKICISIAKRIACLAVMDIYPQRRLRVKPATFPAFKAGNVIQLEPKVLKLLLFLIENRGRLIEKEEILDAIWNGTHVTENALAREIGKLRKTLGDDPKAARYIETVHTRGYRFIAEVTLGNGGSSYAPEAVSTEVGKDREDTNSEAGPPA